MVLKEVSHDVWNDIQVFLITRILILSKRLPHSDSKA